MTINEAIMVFVTLYSVGISIVSLVANSKLREKRDYYRKAYLLERDENNELLYEIRYLYENRNLSSKNSAELDEKSEWLD